MYLKVEKPNDFYYLDLETDGLQPSCIFCCVVLNKGTRQVWRFIHDGSASLYHELRKFFEDRRDAQFCAHNGIPFDFPVLAHLAGCDIPLSHQVDTLVLSYLYSPKLPGGHGLEEYGERLDYPKVPHSDWSKYSPEMLHRCEQDVYLLEKVHDALLKRMNNIGFSELSCSIEHNIRHIIDKQEHNGYYFFQDRAKNLLSVLEQRRSDLAESVQRLFPPKLEKMGEYSKRTRKDGSNTALYEKAIQSGLIVRDTELGFETYGYESFNIGSSKQRLERLLELGYEPTTRTKKGNPKIDEDALLEYAKTADRPEILAMAEWLVVSGRITMIRGNPETGSKGWMGFLNPETSRIHGKALTCGAQSRRFTHYKPNMANVPSPQNGAAWGHEMRACWGVPPGLGRKLVGYDAKGLETHVMCHFLNDPAANKLLLEGDVHTSNMIALQSALDDLLGQGWGTVVRGGGGAKTAMYAVIFGCYPPRLENILHSPKGSGKTALRVIYDTVPGLEKGIEKAKDEWRRNRGFIKCLDGGYVRCPTETAAFNYKIQPNGSILMKLTSIMLDKRLQEEGLWHMKTADIHDEGQHETNEKDAERLGDIAVECITNAGQELNFRVKMTGTKHIGDDWSQTH